MVTIRNFHQHENAEGKKYITLELVGDIEMIQSKQTGRFYATVRKCSIPSSLDEVTARLMIGRNLPGSILKKECDPYSYTMAETGEVVTITHRYDYFPELV